MRTKVTLVLLLLNVGLLFYIVEARHRWEVVDLNNHRVLPPEAASIQSLTISTPGSKIPFRLELHNKVWSLTSPVDWLANHYAVDRILNELQLLEYLHPPFAVAALKANGQSLADFGLDPPKLTLEFTAGNEKTPATFQLQIGSPTTIENQLYVLSPDKTKVEVVARSLSETLQQSLNQLISDTIFTIPDFEFKALSLQGADATVHLQRHGENWAFEAPIVTRADNVATSLAFSRLSKLHLDRFVEEPDATNAVTGLAAPILTITVQGDNRHEILKVGLPDRTHPAAAPTTKTGAAPDSTTVRFASLDGRAPVFTVDFPDALLADLSHAQETLRDHHVIDFVPAAVTAVTLTAPGQPRLALQRLEAPAGGTPAWQIARPGGAPPLPADQVLVRNLLEWLTILSATKTRDDAAFRNDAPSTADLATLGFNNPVREVTLTLAPAPGANSAVPVAPITLQIALGLDKSYTAKVVGQNYVYTVPDDTPDKLPVAPGVYRDRLVHALPDGAQITGLTLTETGVAAPLYSHQLAAGETWAQAIKDEPVAKQIALTSLLIGEASKDAPKPALLRELRARQFVGESYNPTVMVGGEAKPWKYHLELTIALTGGPAGAQTTTSRLDLAERSGGTTQLAGSPANEANAVFEVDTPFRDAMDLLINGPREPIPPPPLAPAVSAPAPPNAVK